jgi:hypothetical protein
MQSYAKLRMCMHAAVPFSKLVGTCLFCPEHVKHEIQPICPGCTEEHDGSVWSTGRLQKRRNHCTTDLDCICPAAYHLKVRCAIETTVSDLFGVI